MRNIRLSYATYALGDNHSLNSFALFAANPEDKLSASLQQVVQQASHVAIVCEDKNTGKFAEIHYSVDGKVTIVEDKFYQNRQRTGLYKISEEEYDYETIKELIISQFCGTPYKLGSNDCWQPVIWLCGVLNIPLSQLSGPLGSEKQVGFVAREAAAAIAAKPQPAVVKQQVGKVIHRLGKDLFGKKKKKPAPLPEAQPKP